MEFILQLFTSRGFFIWPQQTGGWVGLAAMALLLGLALKAFWEDPRETLRTRWGLAVILLILAPACAVFFGVRLPFQSTPLPGIPLDSGSPALMAAVALPWALAAGLLGPVPAFVIALAGGLTVGFLDTHNPLTLAEMGFMALLFSALSRQRYRTRWFALLRRPVPAAIMTAVVSIPVFMASSAIAANGGLAVRLDYAFNQSWSFVLVRGVELLAAAVLCGILRLIRPDWWGRHTPVQPSPLEVGLQTRFLWYGIPMVVILSLTLIVGDWWVAGNAARSMLAQRMSSVAGVAAESIPHFLETGQSLIETYAQPVLLEIPEAQRSQALADRLRSTPFFRQMTLFDARGGSIVGFPEPVFANIYPSDEEKAGINLALKGVAVQVYTIRPLPDENAAQVSFIAAIPSADGQIVGVLLGRTDLASNPFTQPAVRALESLKDLNGSGAILDQSGQVLYPASGESLNQFGGSIPTGAQMRDEISPSGTRSYNYYQPAQGQPWTVVLKVEAQQVQQKALQIALPLLLITLFISIPAILWIRTMLKSVTVGLSHLSEQSSMIARGDLEAAIQVQGADEVGRLATSFESMRLALKARLEELNRLLAVSEGVAANLDIEAAAQPVLEAALIGGASMARVVLVGEVASNPDNRPFIALCAGPAGDVFAYLDGTLFEMMRTQTELMTLPNVARIRRLPLQNGRPHPGALLAMGIRRDDQYYGVFWVAYDTPRNFSEEEIRFLSTLAGEMALAASNARLYATAEAGRQRLQAVLASTPEPVLVFDQDGRLLLLNPAALQVPGLIQNGQEGRLVKEVVSIPELARFISGPLDHHTASREITLPNGKVYYTSISPVYSDNLALGRVCLLRDITHFKELDQMKSDFVATVSHDLRSPLTLMRGYATMLQMVGDLNEQQSNYVKKIVGGVENMTRLVSNLLDLGRIEAGIGLQLERVTVQQIAEEVATALQAQAQQKNIRLTQEIEGDPPVVIEADRALLQQALQNLVENAIKYTQVDGQVKIRLDAHKERVVFQVHDTGIGIAPLDLPRLFEKFYRSGRRESYTQRGTGLGLAIVKSIAERHGGRVWVDSQLGKGSIFYLEMPVHPKSTVRPADSTK